VGSPKRWRSHGATGEKKKERKKAHWNVVREIVESKDGYWSGAEWNDLDKTARSERRGGKQSTGSGRRMDLWKKSFCNRGKVGVSQVASKGGVGTGVLKCANKSLCV